jgi:hypothetical protein
LHAPDDVMYAAKKSGVFAQQEAKVTKDDMK